MTPQEDTVSQLTSSVDEMMNSRGSGDDRGSLAHRGSYEDADEAGQLKGEILDDDLDRGDTFVVNCDRTGSPPLSNDESEETNELDNTDEEPEETIHQPWSYAPVSDVEEDIEEDIKEEGKAEDKNEDENNDEDNDEDEDEGMSTTATVSEREHGSLTPDPTMSPPTHALKHQCHKVFQMAQKSVGLPTGECGPLDNASGMLQASDDLHVVSQLPSPVSVVFNVISNSDVYCFLCQQGGDLVDCDHSNCGRAVCLHCTPDLRQWNMTEQMRFECPACATKRGSDAMQGLYSVQSAEKPWVPLMKGLRILGKPEISLTARLDISSLVLVHLHLRSLPEYGTIANLVEDSHWVGTIDTFFKFVVCEDLMALSREVPTTFALLTCGSVMSKAAPGEDLVTVHWAGTPGSFSWKEPLRIMSSAIVMQRVVIWIRPGIRHFSPDSLLLLQALPYCVEFEPLQDGRLLKEFNQGAWVKVEDFDIVFLNHINVIGMHRSMDCPMKKRLFELLRKATGFYNTHRHTAPVADIERKRIRTRLQQQALKEKSLMAQHVNFTSAPHAMELDHIVTVVAYKGVLKKNDKHDGQGPMLVLVILEPAVILDINNKILTWYLPGILGQAHINDYNDATCGINQLLQRTVSQGGNFWTDADLFIAASSGRFNPGSLDISAGWFARRHNASLES
ncbi:hypothetical protein BKA93DRAFT_750258 [Sparassis latifolia]